MLIDALGLSEKYTKIIFFDLFHAWRINGTNFSLNLILENFEKTIYEPNKLPSNIQSYINNFSCYVIESIETSLTSVTKNNFIDLSGFPKGIKNSETEKLFIARAFLSYFIEKGSIFCDKEEIDILINSSQLKISDEKDKCSQLIKDFAKKRKIHLHTLS